MTTATANRAPTEAEIRQALAERAKDGSSGSTTPEEGETHLRAELRGIAEDYAQAFSEAAYVVLEATEHEYGSFDDVEGIWRDLRPSEARALESLIEAAVRSAAAQAEAIIVNELTAAAMTFATEHPDAPRIGG